jgi:transcriptional regulator with XRE-family HTH domain
MHLGKNIRHLRKSTGMTQEDLADKLGMQNSSIGKWEREINQPNPDQLIILSGLFSVSLDDLITVDLTARPQVQGKNEVPSSQREARLDELEDQVRANHERLIAGSGSDAYREQLEIFKKQLIRQYPDVARKMGFID